MYIGDGLPNLTPISNILEAPNFIASLMDMSELGQVAAGVLQRLMNVFDLNTCAGQDFDIDDADLSKIPLNDLLTSSIMDKVDLIREGLDRIVDPKFGESSFTEIDSQ